MVRRVLTYSGKQNLLKTLEKIGLQNFGQYMQQTLLHNLIPQHRQDKEFLSRYLLLVATLDQQADSESARNTVSSLYNKYGSAFFLNPVSFINRLHEVIDFVKQYYSPKTRVLRMKRETVLLLRVGGFLLAITNIVAKHGGLLPYFSLAPTPRALLDLILKNTLLSGLLYEKAARMYTGWIAHPNLWINISSGRWKASELPMPINGHVCKVLARTGFLSSVLVEDTKRYIVKAEDERESIEREVGVIYPSGDRLMIDFGAFYVGVRYCDETEPSCEQCPITMMCMRNTYFRAY